MVSTGTVKEAGFGGELEGMKVGSRGALEGLVPESETEP